MKKLTFLCLMLLGLTYFGVSQTMGDYVRKGAVPCIVRFTGPLLEGDRVSTDPSGTRVGVYSAPMTIIDSPRLDWKGKEKVCVFNTMFRNWIGQRPDIVQGRNYFILLEPQVDGKLRIPGLQNPFTSAGTWQPQDLRELQAGMYVSTGLSQLSTEADPVTKVFVSIAEAYSYLSLREAVRANALCSSVTVDISSADERQKINLAFLRAYDRCAPAIRLQIAFHFEQNNQDVPQIDALVTALNCLAREDVGVPHGIQQDDFWYPQYALFRPSTVAKHKLSVEDMWRYAMQAKSPELAAAFIRSNTKLPSRATLLAFLPKLKSYWLGTQRDLMYYFAEILREDKLNPKLTQDQETLRLEWANCDESMNLLKQLIERLPE